ncbi:hypothetical protein [Phocaeicola salanitronis]|uniref:hypothetical protein n=1 Tax=Phocaeicola salanitronis TaxID=376805 RepID=UPI0025A3C291|nr:hypothetical protein [Phocaeicola salanitronis]MDM8306090.1 hypothetical protein [Phocaeicola salanitronis]
MKKIIATIIIAIGGGFSVVQAQTQEVDRTVKEDTIWVDYKTRYTSSFWDNFYVEADFAGRMLMGAEDTHLSFGSRLKPGFGITVGKWFHPDFGVRLNFGGARLKGWNSGPTGIYAYDDGWVEGFDPVQEYWKGQGVDTQNGYRQDIKYYELNADFLFDLYNVFTSHNRLNRKWTAQGYVGVGMLRAAKYHGMEDNVKVGLRVGLIGNYHITDRLGLHLSVGSEITDANFTGELGKGNKFSGILSGTIGLSYRIGRQGYRVVRLVPQRQLAALNNAISLIRTEQTVSGDTIVMKERMATGSLLIPSVVFYPGKNEFNEELQMVNIFRIARYMMRYKDAKIAIVGNTGGTDSRLARRRAEKVRDLLVNKYGIFPQRMEIRTYDVNAKYGVTGYEQSVNFTVTE